MKLNQRKKGFTLIELIVVIAILGILAAIAVPRLSGFVTSGKNSADTATAKTITSAVTTLIASGTLTGTGTITVSNPSGTPAATTYGISATAPGTLADANLQTDLANLLGTQVSEQGSAKTGFNVVITTTDVTTTPQ